MDTMKLKTLFVMLVDINVSHVLKPQKHVLLVMETVSIYMIVIAQLDIMKLLTNLIVQLVQMLVKNVLVMKFVPNVTPTSSCIQMHVHQHAQMVIMDHIPITHVTLVKKLVQHVVVNIITTVFLVLLDIS